MGCQSPLWVKSCRSAVKVGRPLYPESGHSSARIECPLCANSGHSTNYGRCPPGISPEVRKWGRYLIFDWIGLSKGNGPVQTYLADDHWRDADKKMVVHSWESQWTKL